MYITSVTEAAQKWFITNVVDSTCIRFEQQEVYSENTAGTASCSEELFDNSDNWIGSIGFRAKYNSANGTTYYGFVTCGHAYTNITTLPFVVTNRGGRSLGTLDATRNVYADNDCLDAAFIRLYTGSTIFPTVETAYQSDFDINTTGIITVSQGTHVCMYGAGTNNNYGYLRTGVVQSSSYTDPGTDNITLIDMVKASYISLPGDSGGLVFVQTSDGSNTTCGIQSRKNGTSFSVFCKATNITSRLNVSIY